MNIYKTPLKNHMCLIKLRIVWDLAVALPTLTNVQLRRSVDAGAGCQLGAPGEWQQRRECGARRGGVCIMPPLEVGSCRQALANAKR